MIPAPPDFAAPPPLLEEDPFRAEDLLTVVTQPSIGREFDVLGANSRSLGEATPTLRGWTGVLDYDLKDGSDRLLLTYRFAEPNRGRWVYIRPQVLADATGRPVGVLEARFAGWHGWRYAVRRDAAEYLVVPTISRFRENPLLQDGRVVGSVRSGGALSSTYTLRFSGPCNRLHALGLLIFIALRTGRATGFPR